MKLIPTLLLGNLIITIQGGVNGSLRGSEVERDLVTSTFNRELHYWYDFVIEKEVDEGGPEDTDFGPSDDVVRCIEASMLSHMDPLARRFVYPDGANVPSVKPWEALKAKYEDEHFHRVVLLKEDDESALLKVFDHDTLAKVEKVPLEKVPGGRKRELSQANTYGVGSGDEVGDKGPVDQVVENPQRELLNQITRKRLRRWRARIRTRARSRCRHCFRDNNDGGRRLAATGAFSSASLDPRRTVNFETWMNLGVQDEVNNDCAAFRIKSESFSLLQNGKVIQTSEPVEEPTPEPEPTEPPTNAPTPLPTEEHQEKSGEEESYGSGGCCSKDLKSCIFDDEYCAFSASACEDVCELVWIDPNATGDCVPNGGECTKEGSVCCDGLRCIGNDDYMQCDQP